MKKYATTLLENMETSTFARITTSWYGSQVEKSSRILLKHYIRVGNLVVSIPNYPKVTAHHTLRHTLMALVIFPKFLGLIERNPSVVIRPALVKKFCEKYEKTLTPYPLSTLLALSSTWMHDYSKYFCGGHLKLGTSPNVVITLANLLEAVGMHTTFIAQRRNSLANINPTDKQKQ